MQQEDMKWKKVENKERSKLRKKGIIEENNVSNTRMKINRRR
jgi:hypothetical protein